VRDITIAIVPADVVVAAQGTSGVILGTDIRSSDTICPFRGLFFFASVKRQKSRDEGNARTPQLLVPDTFTELQTM